MTSVKLAGLDFLSLTTSSSTTFELVRQIFGTDAIVVVIDIRNKSRIKCKRYRKNY